jgi:glycosyltransferase involved in cell wall biosynthesis
MKVLVSAIACNPYLGSENYFGWAAVKALSKDHDLWVLTSERNVVDLQRAKAEGLVPDNVHFVFAGKCAPWHSNRMRARLQSWMEYLGFTRAILQVAAQLHSTEKFDLVHHVTYTTWRVATPLWRLGIPFVFGPISGNEQFPFRLFPLLSPTGAAFELARKTSNVTSCLSPAVRQSVRQAAHVFTVTMETLELIKTMRGSEAGVSQLSPGFYSPETMAEFSRFVPEKNVNGVLRLYAAGNLGGQKCIALAFRALARAKRSGVKFRYHLGANGPEIPHLKKLAIKLDLTQEVIFGGPMSRADYQQELGNTHIYLLPSMRETVGLTGLEAMLAGCVPVVADNGGPGLTVTEECGYKTAVTNSRQMVEELAAAIITLDRNRQLITEKGRAASARVAGRFTETNYRAAINEVYRSVTVSRTKQCDKES